MNSVLKRESFVNRRMLQLARDDEAHHISNHERYDDCVVSRQLKDHEHRGKWNANDAGETCAHADQCIRARIGSYGWKKRMCYTTDRGANHRAQKETRTEYAAGV